MSGGVTQGVTRGVTQGRRVTGAAGKRQLSVERLLQWAYAEQRVRGLPSWKENGAPVLGGGAGGQCHDDAITLDQLVSALVPRTGKLVREHAIARTRPGWKSEARHRIAPWQWDEVGAARFAVVFLTHPRDCTCHGMAHRCTRWPLWEGSDRPARYCPVLEVDRPEDVQRTREEFWLRWWCGLEVIRNAIRSDEPLAAHTVTDELPPRFPWAPSPAVDGRTSMG